LEKKDMLFLDGNDKIKLPFITLANVYGILNNKHFPKIQLLDSLDSALSWEQAEYLTLAVIVFKLWGIHRRLVNTGKIRENGQGYCQLSELVPLRKDQDDVSINFRPWFVIRQTDHQIKKGSWSTFYRDARMQLTKGVTECIAFRNRKGASFPDTFLITDPVIFIQEKSSLTSNKDAAEGGSGVILPPKLLKEERDKCPDNSKHIFILSTDYRKRDDQEFKPNDVLITRENRKAMYGELLTLRKLHCLESI
jgi:hypothetical protein